MEHETQSVEFTFITEENMGVTGRGLDGERGLIGQESRKDHRGARTHECQSVERRDHQAVTDPHHGQAQNQHPERSEVGRMMFHGVNGTQPHINGGVALPLDGQHPLIQRDSHPL